MQNDQDLLRDILDNGLRSDIFFAERARELHRTIGRSADKVNAKGYGELFSYMQNSSIGELTIAVAKLYERQGTRYPVRSIPAIAQCLRSHAQELQVVQAQASVQDFERISERFRVLSGLQGEAFSLKLADLIEETCPDPSKQDACELSRGLDALRASRDKAIAHNEATDRQALPQAKWSDAEALLDHARDITSGIAMAYFGIVYKDDTGYSGSTADAGVAALQLTRLLKAAGVIDS